MNDIAPDGSPVAFYRFVPTTGEPELIHSVIAPGASVLDLGCGPGRIAGPLTALGHAVTGVDDGPGMIVALPAGVEGVVADARTVRLGRRFGAVLLMSHLLKIRSRVRPWPSRPRPTLAPAGVVVAEVYPERWDPSEGVGRVSLIGDAYVELLRAKVTGRASQTRRRASVKRPSSVFVSKSAPAAPIRSAPRPSARPPAASDNPALGRRYSTSARSSSGPAGSDVLEGLDLRQHEREAPVARIAS